MSRTFRPTIRSSMWSTIPTPWRMPISAARSISSTSPSRSPSSATGTPRLELDLDGLRLVGRELGPRDELEDVVVGRVGEVLDPLALGGAAPQVVVDRVRRALRAALDRDAVLARVGDLLVAAHRPRADGGDHLQLGRERRDRALDAHLVVALARAAVGDRVAAGLAGVLDGELGDQRAAERGEERVAVAVVGVGLDRRQHVLLRELLARVDHVAVERAELQRLAAHDVVVLPGLPEVDGQRDDLGLVLVLDPLEHHARVQAAAVEQQHAPDLSGLGQVAGDPRGVGVGDAVDFCVGGGIARLFAHGRDSLERAGYRERRAGRNSDIRLWGLHPNVDRGRQRAC